MLLILLTDFLAGGQAIAAEITDFSSEKRQLFEGNKPVRSQLLGHISAYLELSQPNHNKKVKYHENENEQSEQTFKSRLPISPMKTHLMADVLPYTEDINIVSWLSSYCIVINVDHYFDTTPTRS